MKKGIRVMLLFFFFGDYFTGCAVWILKKANAGVRRFIWLINIPLRCCSALKLFFF